MTDNLPSPDLLRKLLRYEPDTGKLFWLPRHVGMFASERSFKTWTKRFCGKQALTYKTVDGYYQGTVLYKLIYAHRIIWAMVHNNWPEFDVDHINGNRGDNRLCNLRSVTRSTNMKNAKKRKDNTSGHNGVVWRDDCNRWVAQIGSDGKHKYIGSFKKKSDAIKARREAETDMGFTVRHGL